MNSRRVFRLGGKVGHVTRHVRQRQLFKVKRSNTKVTRSRNVSPDRTLTRQWMIIATSNFVGIIAVGVDACDIFSRPVCHTSRKHKYGGHSAYKIQKINGKRRQIAETSHAVKKIRSEESNDNVRSYTASS